jgi:hypothetical protein
MLRTLIFMCVSSLLANGTLLGTLMGGGVWSRALQQTMLEQEAEDTNSQHRIGDHLARRLICLPINDAFAASAINGMHGKVITESTMLAANE